MSRLLMILLTALCSVAAHAQIFPHLEIGEIQRRIQQGDTTPDPGTQPDKPDVPDKPETPVVDRTKAYDRYQQLVRQYKAEERAIRTESVSYAESLHESVRGYLEGLFLLRMGFYSEAETRLMRVGHRVTSDRDITSEGGRAIIAEIKAGKAYFHAAIAASMSSWADFDSADDLNTAWDRAWEQVTRRPLRSFENARNRNQLEDFEDVNRLFASLRINGRSHWRARWNAEREVRQTPISAAAWQQLASSLGPGEGLGREDMTPNYLLQRAALTVLTELFQDAEFVVGGRADIARGFNYLGIGQIKDYTRHFAPKPYHAGDAGTRLLMARGLADRLVEVLEGLKR
jgi:hypothetical protein